MLVIFLKKKPTLPKTYLKAFMKSISKNLTFKKPFLQKRKEKENVNEHSQRDNHHSTNPRFTYGSISKRSSHSCKKERERMVMNVLRETHPSQTQKNLPIDFISKRIQKSPSPRDPFLQKRILTNVFKETIITLPTQDSLTDSLSKRVWESPSPRDPFL